MLATRAGDNIAIVAYNNLVGGRTNLSLTVTASYSTRPASCWHGALSSRRISSLWISTWMPYFAAGSTIPVETTRS